MATPTTPGDSCSKSSEEINRNEEHSEDMLDLLTGLK
jgi:hypothetical protein